MSGGAPETVLDGETGRVVDGRRADQVAEAIGDILADRDAAAAMGAAGRAFVDRHWRWDTLGARLRGFL